MEGVEGRVRGLRSLYGSRKEPPLLRHAVEHPCDGARVKRAEGPREPLDRAAVSSDSGECLPLILRHKIVPDTETPQDQLQALGGEVLAHLPRLHTLLLSDAFDKYYDPRACFWFARDVEMQRALLSDYERNAPALRCVAFTTEFEWEKNAVGEWYTTELVDPEVREQVMSSDEEDSDDDMDDDMDDEMDISSYDDSGFASTATLVQRGRRERLASTHKPIPATTVFSRSAAPLALPDLDNYIASLPGPSFPSFPEAKQSSSSGFFPPLDRLEASGKTLDDLEHNAQVPHWWQNRNKLFGAFTTLSLAITVRRSAKWPLLIGAHETRF